MFPSESSVTRQPGGTTQVASYSSTISGPSRGGESSSAAREMHRHVERPVLGPEVGAPRGSLVRSEPLSPASGSYGASPFPAARAVSFRLTMSIGASAEACP